MKRRRLGRHFAQGHKERHRLVIQNQWASGKSTPSLILTPLLYMNESIEDIDEEDDER